MGTEAAVSVPNTGTAPVRVLQVTTLVGGVAQTADMQVISIADPSGAVLFDPSTELSMMQTLQQIASDMQLLRAAFERWSGVQGF